MAIFGGGSGTGFFMKGGKEAKAGLNELADKAFGDASSKIFRDLGQQAVNEMKSAAPVKTGFLRDNIEATEVSDTSLTIESKAPYSGFVEFGTIYQREQQFFRPALVAFDRDFISAYGREVGYSWRVIAGKYNTRGFR